MSFILKVAQTSYATLKTLWLWHVSKVLISLSVPNVYFIKNELVLYTTNSAATDDQFFKKKKFHMKQPLVQFLLFIS